MLITQELTELLGYAAAGLVVATFSARSITTLRALAIASNLLFIAYAASAGLLPVLLLHAVLLPLNVIRLRQAMAEGRGQAEHQRVRERSEALAHQPRAAAQGPLRVEPPNV
jgi:hypothetical protein